MSNCKHISKVIEWGFDDKFNFAPIRYGCVNCEETSPSLWVDEEVKTAHSSHTDYVDGCFGCKIGTLELGTGDAGRADSMPQKKWDKELDAYKNARRQGIQPAGTSLKAVHEALDKSDKAGKAFNANY